jgi:molybdopterin-binding protein
VSLVLVYGEEAPFELRKAVDALSLFVGAMSFAIVKSPQSVTVDEHWMENFAASCAGLELDQGVAAVAVVQLDRLPR